MSPWFVLPAIASAVMSAWLLARWRPAPAHRTWSGLDGLRGLAAFSVFLHHSAIWYDYTHSGIWTGPPSHFYNNLGQGGVAVFFMLTGLLFWDKLRADPHQDWLRLFVSRFLRIAPLYALSMVVVLVLAWRVAAVPGFHPGGDALWHVATFAPTPDLFGVPETFMFNAGVAWTLHYEWMFYFALPLLALALELLRGGRVGIGALAGAALGYALARWLTGYGYDLHLLLYFVYGAIGREVACLAVARPLRTLLAAWPGSVLVVAALVLGVHRDHSAYTVVPSLFYALAFIPLAAGNTLFGVLKTPALRKLGEISYSVYLLQGFVLYATFESATLADSLLEHWLAAAVAAPALIVLAQASYAWVERPAMRSVARVVAWLRAAWRRALVMA